MQKGISFCVEAIQSSIILTDRGYKQRISLTTKGLLVDVELNEPAMRYYYGF